MSFRWLIFFLVMGPGLVFAGIQERDYKELLSMSFEEIMNVEIVTATHFNEKISDAPATVIVITRQDIIHRGYMELTQIFDDLPGMDMIRVNGDISFKNYWRGFRNSFGSPYLFLLDGLEWRDLYYNDAEVMRAFPLSNIEQIEIVYGPASSVYGTNAFMGVINIITVKEKKSDGSYLSGHVAGGSKETAVADLSLFFQRKDIRLSLTARFENRDAFPKNNNRAEWSRSRYIQDRRLWGGFIDSPAAAGLHSLDRHRAVDFRVYVKRIELGFQFYELTSGYSIQYAADRVLPNVVWTKQDYSAYARYHYEFNERFSGHSVLRFCRSDIPGNSALAEGFNFTDHLGWTQRVINYERWQTLNHCLLFQQDFVYRFDLKLSMATGFKYVQKNLQKAYEISPGPFMLPGQVTADTYPFPESPDDDYKYDNRIITTDKSVHFNLKYAINSRNKLHTGVRYDENSQYGNATTLRAGYIRNIGCCDIKFLYGEGFQEPSPRVLYGAWNGLGSDPDLKPERSRTAEVNIQYTHDEFNQVISFYHVWNYDTILNLSQGGRNVGKREIYGLDFHLRYQPHDSWMKGVKLWAYYSYIHTRGDEIYMPETNRYAKGPIGDIAPHKIYAGITVPVASRITATLFGRYVSARQTVATNPVDEVAAYTVADLNIEVRDFLASGLHLSFKVNNLFDASYMHPGIRTADSGNEPGYFDDSGVWHGSAGWLNSLLPQFRRTFVATLRFDL